MQNIVKVELEDFKTELIFQNSYTKFISVFETFSYQPPIITETFFLSAGLTSKYDELHNIQHHVDVYSDAMIILSEFNLEKNSNIGIREYQRVFELVACASLLHDAIDHEYADKYFTNIKKIEKFLDENSTHDKSFKDDMKWILDNVSYSKEIKSGYKFHKNKWVQLVRNIVSDADKLQSLGINGIIRSQQYVKMVNNGASSNEVTNITLQYCNKKLLKLKDHYMRTLPGKRMAEKGHQFIWEFVQKNTKKNEEKNENE